MTEEAKKARREYARAWRAKNAQRNREYHKKWRAANRDKMSKYQQDYWQRKAQELLGDDAS